LWERIRYQLSERLEGLSRFRILSLDGGGIKGTFTAAVLAELEQMTGKRIADHFDLITGTSTGGLIAIALGLGIPAKEILKFYEDKGPAIFPMVGLHGRVKHSLSWWFGPKFSATDLRNAIGSVLGNRKLGESKCRLVIPSFNAGSCPKIIEVGPTPSYFERCDQ